MSHICIYLTNAKSQVLSVALGPCDWLFGYDCGGGLVFVMRLCFCFSFGIYNCNVHIKKPQNLYPISECTYGVEGMDCEIVVAVGVG